MSVCIPTYMLASGLIAGGMSWWQAIGTILLGNLIVLVPMLLNAHAGTKYGIPFPVFVRASFGVRGANVPAVLRALVACGWFGIQTWIGGQAIFAMLGILWPHRSPVGGFWICFFAFWALNIFVIWRGIETIKFLEGIAAPFMLAVGLLLLWWITSQAGGLGPVLSAPSKFRSTAEFMRFFIPSLTGMVGFWATVALNIPDFTRYAKSQRDQALGQALGLPAAMTLVFLHRRRRDFGFGGDFRPADLGSGGAAGAIQPPGGRLHRVGRIADRDAEHQRRRERRLAFERFLQSESAPHFVSHRRPDHRSNRRAADAVEVAGRFQRLHFRMAGGIFGAARADRGHHDRRLFRGRGSASSTWTRCIVATASTIIRAA